MHFDELDHPGFRFFTPLELVGTRQVYAGRVYDVPFTTFSDQPPESFIRHAAETSSISIFHTPDKD
jgi:hypothetical protein